MQLQIRQVKKEFNYKFCFMFFLCLKHTKLYTANKTLQKRLVMFRGFKIGSKTQAMHEDMPFSHCLTNAPTNHPTVLQTEYSHQQTQVAHLKVGFHRNLNLFFGCHGLCRH